MSSDSPNRPSFQDEATRLAGAARERASDAVEEIKLASNQLVDKVRELIEEGNVRRVAIRKGERTLLEIPLTVGLGAGAGALLFSAPLAALGALAALVSDVTLVVERDPEAGAELDLEHEAQDALAEKGIADPDAPVGNAARPTSDDKAGDDKTMGRGDA